MKNIWQHIYDKRMAIFYGAMFFGLLIVFINYRITGEYPNTFQWITCIISMGIAIFPSFCLVDDPDEKVYCFVVQEPNKQVLYISFSADKAHDYATSLKNSQYPIFKDVTVRQFEILC